MRKRLTAREIVHTFTPGDYSGDPQDNDSLGLFWKDRLSQAKWSPVVAGSETKQSLFDDIKEHGQKRPISLNLETKEILDGHHRLAALYHLNPNQFVKYRGWKPS